MEEGWENTEVVSFQQFNRGQAKTYVMQTVRDCWVDLVRGVGKHTVKLLACTKEITRGDRTAWDRWVGLVRGLESMS